MKIFTNTFVILLLTSLFSLPVSAEKQTLVTYKALHPDVAIKLAKASLEACRKAGYQVAIAVVDRMGITQVLVRDQYAGAHTPDTAYRKAWTAASFRTNTSELADMTQAGKPQSGVRQVTQALMIGGGLLIETDGSVVGAVGVSGAPGGEMDDMCAKKGLVAIEEDLFL
ncbi:MAG: heme-binding protein [Gammaproteobacteria bacterium]|nr:heme-binding protein [Gammaproteobacteria bacterium]